MSYIEEQLNAIASSLETHAELMKYSNSWSIAKSADAIRELAKQHTEQLAEVEQLAQVEIETLKAQVEQLSVFIRGYEAGYKDCYLDQRIERDSAGMINLNYTGG